MKLALRRDDDGNEHNRVQLFTVIGIDAPEVDPFAPSRNGGEPSEHNSLRLSHPGGLQRRAPACRSCRRLLSPTLPWIPAPPSNAKATCRRSRSAWTSANCSNRPALAAASMGLAGPPWLWFDIDRADLDAALLDARRLAYWLVDRYRLDDDALLIFFSGSKGFHLGLPTSLWGPEPSTKFHRVCRRLAERIAEAARHRHRSRAFMTKCVPSVLRILGIQKPPCTSAGSLSTNCKGCPSTPFASLPRSRSRSTCRRRRQLANKQRRTGPKPSNWSGKQAKRRRRKRRIGNGKPTLNRQTSRLHPRRGWGGGPASALYSCRSQSRRIRLPAGACSCAAQ